MDTKNAAKTPSVNAILRNIATNDTYLPMVARIRQAGCPEYSGRDPLIVGLGAFSYKGDERYRTFIVGVGVHEDDDSKVGLFVMETWKGGEFIKRHEVRFDSLGAFIELVHEEHEWKPVNGESRQVLKMAELRKCYFGGILPENGGIRAEELNRKYLKNFNQAVLRAASLDRKATAQR
jgi:hypothetical protein